MKTPDELGQAIREVILSKNLSIREVASLAGMSHSQLIRILQGKNFTIQNLLRVLDVLEIEIRFVPYREKEKKEKENEN